MSNGEKFGLRRKAMLGILLGATLILQFDNLRLTPGRTVASAYVFSIEKWEASNLHRKWWNLLWEALPGRKPSREERLTFIDDYLHKSRLVQKEKAYLEDPSARRGGALASESAGKGSSSLSDEYLNELLKAREKLRPAAEEGLEAELSSVLINEGLGSRLGLLFPPVDLRFDQPPTILITSPRDRIHRQEVLLLLSDLDLLERDRIEKDILSRYDLSALVDNLGGIATYPSMVPDTLTLRAILQLAAHEWLHHYLFFRPLGRHMRSSEEMLTLNETAADLAGRELGDKAFALMGGDLTVSARRYLSGEEQNPRFTREMRTTRARVEELLAQGLVEEAEQYMKERWWYMALGGYRLRKLNQAFFAFRGSYADGSGSISPIGDQVEELRSLHPDVGSFIRSVSNVSGYQQFLDLLETLRPREPSGVDNRVHPPSSGQPNARKGRAEIMEATARGIRLATDRTPSQGHACPA